MDNKVVYLHIGTHKTGSTSIQKYLYYNQPSGYRYYSGISFRPCNHLELHLASIRNDRASNVEMRHIDVLTDEYRRSVRYLVRRFIDESDVDRLIFSSEDLSMLRHDDEVERLARMFEGCTVVPIVFFRERSAFLRSWKQQLRKMRIYPSSDPDSACYVGTDGWRTNYEGLSKLYERHFGQIIQLDYDDALRRYGSVIPEFLRTIGIEPDASHHVVWENATRVRYRMPGLALPWIIYRKLPVALRPRSTIRALRAITANLRSILPR